MTDSTILENGFNIGMLLTLIIITIYLSLKYSKVFKYSSVFFIIFIILQISLCNFIIECEGVSLAWNAQLGYLLCTSVFDNKYKLEDKNTLIICLFLITLLANMFFYQEPIITHVSHAVAFSTGFVAGFIK